jgi:integrase
MLYTAQRLSDVLAMTRNQVTERDGRLFIALRQGKTDELLDVPVHMKLEPLLRTRLADPSGVLYLVPSPTGRPWSRRNFSRMWDNAFAKAQLSNLQRRDLRRTAVVLMAQAGLSAGQIAAITGHRIDSTVAILNTYLPRRTEVALAGIEAWERASIRLFPIS